MIIGQKEIFGFELPEMLDSAARLRECNIFIGGRSICCDDNMIYTIAFITSLQHELQRLIKTYNFLKHEMLFYGKGIEEMHALLRQHYTYGAAIFDYAELDKDKDIVDSIDDLEFMRWGPTTDNVVAFLLPVFGRIYLSYDFWRETHQPVSEIGRVYVVEVTPYYLMKTIEEAIALLQKEWVKPNYP